MPRHSHTWLSALYHRLRHVYRACRQAPGRRDWLEAAAIFGGVGAVGLLFGLRSRLVRFEPMKEPWPRYVLLSSLLAITPGLSEELVFRGLLLPHPAETATPRSRLVAFVLSLAAFILWHPINGWRRRPDGGHIFHDHRFLIQTAILGSACATTYLRSGSIWPPAVMHWLVVSAWILTLGGRRQLES